MATPVDPPELIIPVNVPDDTTENPCKELLLMLSVVVAVPALFEIPVIAPVDAFVQVRIPDVELPTWLLLIFVATPAAPVLEIPIKPAVEDTIENPVNELLFRLIVVPAEPPAFKIPVIAPAVELVKLRNPPFESPSWLYVIAIVAPGTKLLIPVT